MRRKKRLVSVFLVVLTLMSAHLPALADSAEGPEAFPRSDNFVSGKLGDFWTIIRQEDGTFSMEKGMGLHLTAKKASITSGGTEWRNVVVQPAYGDYEIVTKTYLPVAPYQNYQHTALLVYQDEDNYLKVDVEWTGYRIRAQFAQETNGVFNNGAQTGTFSKAADGSFTIFYKIKKTGDTYVGSYSTDGITFTNIGTRTVTYPNPHIGLFSTEDSNNTEIETYYEYVELLSKDGVELMTTTQMVQKALDAVADYVAEDVPAVVDGSFAFSPVPHGYALSVVSDKPDILSNTGEIVERPLENTKVNLEITVTEDARTSVRTASVIVEGTNKPDIGTVSLSGISKLVAGTGASVPVIIQNPVEGLRARLFGKTLDIVDGRAKFVLAAADIPDSGAYTVVVIDAAGVAVGSADLQVVDLPVGIWDANLENKDGKLAVKFNWTVSKAPTFAVTVGGTPVIDPVVNENYVLTNIDYASVASGAAVVIRGVKFADLFPSYGFTFTESF